MLGKETLVCVWWFGIKDCLWSTPVISYRLHKTMFFLWKMLVKGMVPLFKCPSLHYFIHRAIEIPSNLELGELSRKLSSPSTA